MEPHAKKRRLNDGESTRLKPNKHTPRFRPTKPRDWTLSVAVPTSVITECDTREQRTTLAGRIARALAIFSIDEVVVYDDSPPGSRPAAVDEDAYTGDTAPAHFLEHLITYLETPPFMRRALFPIHPNLKSQGLLPNMDMPHHPYKAEWMPYREGLTTSDKPQDGKGTVVDIGLSSPVTITDGIPPRTRVTLKMPNNDGSKSETNTRARPEPVHPAAPRTEAGYFWGFSVRRCPSLSAVFTTAPFEDGYDKSIGTSKRGLPLFRAFTKEFGGGPGGGGAMMEFKHLLIVFGGPRGLEYAAMNDPELSKIGIAGSRTNELFDHWVNVLPNQGSMSIRTDEALMIALTGLRPLWTGYK